MFFLSGGFYVKKLKLGKKITGGFIIILGLLFLIALVGWLSLTEVVKKVDSANEFQLLVNHVLEARQNEKRFILTNDAKAVEKVNKELSQLKNKTQQIFSVSKSEDTKKNSNEILKKLDKYSNAFSNYVVLAGKKDFLMKDMTIKADLALKTSASIREKQTDQYNKLKEESVPKIEQMRANVKLAADIEKHFINAKGYRVALIAMDVRKNASFYAEWTGKHKNLKMVVDKLGPLLKEDVPKKALAFVVKAQNDCIKNGKAFFYNKSDDTRFPMIKTAAVLNRAVILLNQELQEQLEFYMEDVQIFSDEMIEISSGVARAGNILLKTRILEKEYIRTEDEKIFKEIIENLQAIDKVIGKVKETIGDEEKTK
ncbi:MAG: hypothetical protein GY707_13180 [Desulfobacteraceae bacterium]|nr:hypothetical protein [Desulfobacteraceae bacterium]